MADQNNQRIAKNTIFLYFRMLLIMLVNLYASRVTLKVLGVDDFGIYQTVGGVVTFLAFLSNALGSGTSRFITFEMGKKDPKLKELFSTVRIAHIILGVFIVIIGEIIGMWALYNKLVIPDDRLGAAIFAFHFSMIATFFQITQVPYNATIIAYEKMNVYAYVSIIEAVGKLLIVYLLNILLFDKLKVYAVLMCLVTVGIMLIYRIYCRKHFEETKTILIFDKDLFKGVASFSGWNLLTSSAASLANQGVTIVTNMFFSPAVVTVRSLALKINNILNQFVGSFRTAVNPQIVKKYAAGDYDGSKKLALISTKYTYYLMLLIVLPLFLLCQPALKIWLGDVPDGLTLFVRIALIQGLFQAFDTSLYTPIYAKGRIKENAIISPLFDALQLPAVYILFKLGAPAITLAWVELFACVVLGIIIKPILVHLIVHYDYKEIMLMIVQCGLVTILACIIPCFVSTLLNSSTVIGFLGIGCTCLISMGVVIWFIGLDKYMRDLLIGWTKSKFLKK
jgi:O-antigen/teichoic acid export membrane protein